MTPPDYQNNRGFTLIELLVAVVILAIITLTMFTAFNTFMKTSDRVRNESDFATRFQTGFRTMMDDLEQIYLLRAPEYRAPELKDSPDPYRFEASRESNGGTSFSRLRFSSLNHLPMGGATQSPPATITYYVGQRHDSFCLFRSDIPSGTPGEDSCPDPVLFEHVERFDLEFSDGDADFRDTWDSDTKENLHTSPRKVRISITVKETSGEHTLSTTLVLPKIRNGQE